MQVYRSTELQQGAFKHPGQILRHKQHLACHEEVASHMQSSERLGLLHSRLQQEAEKIRKWKSSTELEIRQKNHQIQTSQQLIDKQQKSLIELQLQNESLNSRIEEETANQKEIQRKIHSTRDMCHALKEHVCKIESAVEFGEDDRKELLHKNTFLDQQYSELLECFKSLEEEQSLMYDSLREKIKLEQTKSEELSMNLSELTTSSEEQIEVLQSELNIVNTQCMELKSVQESQKKQLSCLESENDTLEVRLSDRDACLRHRETDIQSKDVELAKREVEVKTLKDSIELLNGETNQLKLLYDEGQRHITKLIETHQQREKELLAYHETLEEQIKGHCQRLTELESQLRTTEEEKCSLSKQHDSLLINLTTSEDRNTTLEHNLMELQERFDELQGNYTSLQCQLSSCEEELLTIHGTLEEREREKETLRENLVNSLEEKDQKIAHLVGNVTEAQNTLSTLQDEKTIMLLKIEERDGIIDKLSKENESIQYVMKSNNEEKLLQLKLVKEELAQRTSAEQELTKQNNDLMRELEKLSQESKVKLEELKSQVECKDKSISNYQLEISEFTSQTKMETLLFEKRIQSLVMEKEEIQETMKQLSHELCLCQSREEEAKKGMDALAKEMGLTLEKYQAENTHIVEQKDKEIETLREAKMSELKEKEELKEKVLELEKELHQEKRDDSVEDIEQYRLEIQKLESQLKVKDDEIAQLLIAASTLQAQIKTPKKNTLHPSTPKAGPPFKTPLRQPHHSYIQPRANTFSTPVTPQCNSSKERAKEKRLLKELHPEVSQEHESQFKRPKTKVTSTGPRYSVGFSGRGNTRRTKGKVTKDTERKENLSWFDSDPVFGFPSDD